MYENRIKKCSRCGWSVKYINSQRRKTSPIHFKYCPICGYYKLETEKL